jgi:hypothetical protein
VQPTSACTTCDSKAESLGPFPADGDGDNGLVSRHGPGMPRAFHILHILSYLSYSFIFFHALCEKHVKTVASGAGSG